MSHNPLLAPIDAFVDYAAITPEHIEPAITELIAQSRAAVTLAADPACDPDWDNFITPLENASEKLWRAWSVASHLNAVVNTPALREAYNVCLAQVTEFSTWVGLHAGLYAQYQRLRAGPHYRQLTPTRARIVDLALRDFRLSGVELAGAPRARYAQISEQEAQASQKFSENVLDATDNWSLHIEDETRLDGVPADTMQSAHAAAAQKNLPGWLLTLKMPCYLPVMQHAKNRELRETLYRAYATLACEQGDPALDNSKLIEQLLALRAEQAQLLGFPDYATLRLQTRMADNAEQVLNFLRQLAGQAKPYALRDLAQLRQFAKDELALDTLEMWDIPFATERLREARYAYSEEEIKPYFTEAAVFKGLFDVVEKLYDLRIRDADIATWRPDARALQIETAGGKLLGHLFIDLYARNGKQGGAWVDSERNRRKIGDRIQTPIAYLTCNFSAPHGAEPALLTHDDVITLFHESGHALHALLSEVDDPAAAAFASVEWDAIELPSQFMENFCWEWPVVQALSKHVSTGEPLPRSLYDKLLAAKNFQSGMQTVRQIEFSLFDMIIHHQKTGLDIGAVLDTLQQVRQEVAVLFAPSWQRFPHNFSHIFAGGYGAGYYSYKWAEVLSADAYAAFEEGSGAHGDTLNPVIGQRFRKEILAVGGARPAADSFYAFRGRAPSMDALLRHNGMAGPGL
ncbi:M3 family metallopeptidase [Paralcaligenes ureilyticus]|uniref:oligopeptidase A n=1 Tax=Paralcaligenes ureilyticus TaxID=627131 RepID=A0A4R3LLY9_9BURK|nr:M3 family metallopeptidase [Paralcaligenes ureilyticus]TCT00626.1 oligopeptidase A [Paralcaligenes ureilyticus]